MLLLQRSVLFLPSVYFHPLLTGFPKSADSSVIVMSEHFLLIFSWISVGKSFQSAWPVAATLPQPPFKSCCDGQWSNYEIAWCLVQSALGVKRLPLLFWGYYCYCSTAYYSFTASIVHLLYQKQLIKFLSRQTSLSLCLW